MGVAEQGRLETVDSAAELKERIERFRANRFPPPAATNWSARIARNWRIKLLAVAFAGVAWMAFTYRPDVVGRTLDVPIEYRNVPEHVSAPSNLKISRIEPLRIRPWLTSR